jgi:hypothetical protein
MFLKRRDIMLRMDGEHANCNRQPPRRGRSWPTGAVVQREEVSRERGGEAGSPAVNGLVAAASIVVIVLGLKLASGIIGPVLFAATLASDLSR